MTSDRKKIWRYLPYCTGSGAYQMAVDEAILEACRLGTAPPTLRLYNFVPACVSIGLAQKLDRQAVERIRAAGYDLVRRPSGGRAVLHEDDLTYAFTGLAIETGTSGRGSEAGFLAQGTLAAYQQIAAGLIQAFKLLGLELTGGQRQAYRHLADCFAALGTADLGVEGKKMIGSAQVRRGRAVLQHGSILLRQKQESLPALLSAPAPLQEVKQRHANLVDYIPNQDKTENILAQLEAAILTGFERSFKCQFAIGTLSSTEEEFVRQSLPKYESSGRQAGSIEP